MTGRERVALMRLLIICAAWALGEALVWQLRAFGLAGAAVPFLLGAAAYVATRGGDGGGGGDGNVIYWRGRRIDRDRWN